MKRVLLLFLSAVLCLSLLACGGEPAEETPSVGLPEDPTQSVQDHWEIVILFTGGLENIYQRDTAQGFIGYAALTAYRNQLEASGKQVILVDGGESVGGEGTAAFDGGDAIWDIIDAVGYDIRIPGAQELSQGIDELQERADDLSECAYISCNLTEGTSGETVFTPYMIVEAGEMKIGFVGITTPKPQDRLTSDGSYRLTQDDKQVFYDTVQQAVDSVINEGADYVIGVGNLGTDLSDSPWTSAELLANTTGFAAFLDCGSGAVLDGDIVVDKDDFETPVCAPGSQFCYVGQVTLDLNDGAVSVVLLDELEDEDEDIRSKAEELTSDMEAATEPVEDTTAVTEETTE